MLKANSTWLSFLMLLILSTPALADSTDQLSKKLRSDRIPEIESAATQILNGDGESALFADFSRALTSCWSYGEEKVAKHVLDALAALVKRYPEESGWVLFDLLKVDYAPVTVRLRELFLSHPERSKVVSTVVVNPDIEAFRLENMLMLFADDFKHSPRAGLLLIRRSLTHRTGRPFDRSRLIQRSVAELDKILSASKEAANDGQFIAPALLETLNDDGWLPKEGEDYSEIISPLYAVAEVAARCVPNPTQNLLPRAQFIYGRIRQHHNLPKQDDARWLRLLSLLSGRPARDSVSDESPEYQKLDEIVSEFEKNADTSLVGLGPFVEVRIRTVLRCLANLSQDDTRAIMGRIAALTGRATFFREQLFTAIRASENKAAIEILDRCAFWIGGGHDNDHKA